MNRSSIPRFISAVSLAVFLACFTCVEAKKPDKPGGGGGGGGGGSTAAYTIIDLPGPYHDANGGSSRTFAERISDVGAGGKVYVLGYDHNYSSPCVWTVDADGVSVEDITGAIDFPNDVNAAGIIAGIKNDRAALLLANNQIVYLEDATLSGRVWAINNPDISGDFQAVGYTTSNGSDLTPVLWDVNVDGTVWLSTPLIESNGFPFVATDVNDAGMMGGRVIVDNQGEGVPAVAVFTQQGLEASLRPNPNPTEITSIFYLQVDEGGNLLGDGSQYVGPFSYSRAVIWPASGGAIDLTAETGYTTTGGGIALVNNVMQAVGRADRDARGPSAYLYTNGSFKNLGTLSKGEDPWTFDSADGINRAGLICGAGTVGRPKNQQRHAFLLIPNAP